MPSRDWSQGVSTLRAEFTKDKRLDKINSGFFGCEKQLHGHIQALREAQDKGPNTLYFLLIKCIPEHVACNDSMHSVSTPHVHKLSWQRGPPWGKNTRSRWGHIVDGSAFALDLMSGNTSGGIQRSFIYRYAITFINVCLVKWLPHFNLILPLANYLLSVRAMFNGQTEEERKKAALSS